MGAVVGVVPVQVPIGTQMHVCCGTTGIGIGGRVVVVVVVVVEVTVVTVG